MLLVIATLATVVAASGFGGASQATRDRSVKRAIAAADAGLETAVYRMNKLAPKTLECAVNGVVQGATGLAIEPVQPDGWCREQTEDLGEGASYSYRVKGGAQVNLNGQNLVQRTVVSTGTVNGVKRRALTVVGSPISSLFGAKGVLSDKTLTVKNNAYIAADVASNEDVVIENNGEICGNVTYGLGPWQFRAANNARYACPGTSATQATARFLLSPVDGELARTSNDNGRIGNQDVIEGGVSWDSAKRVLRINNNARLTLTGDVYSFCYLEVENNAELVVAVRAAGRPPLKIYIDKPENCDPTISNRGSVKVENNAAIRNLGSDPSALQLYVAGSPLLSTFVRFRNNSTTQQMLVWAPQSSFLVENNGDWLGAVAAKQVTVENNGRITYDSRAALAVDANVLPVYQRQSWLECTTAPRGNPAPDSGCS